MKKVLCCAMLSLVLAVAGPIMAREAQLRIHALLDELKRNAAQESVAYAGELSSLSASDAMEATLYFRFGQTDVLGVARTQLDIRRDETVARLIVEQLIDGPRSSQDRLRGVFPQGTQLVSVSGEGSTAIVTFNRAFLGRPDGAPSNWEDLAVWQEEAALRRRLALQSVVLALTEGGRYQRVSFYVADSDDDLPQRIEMAWLQADAMDDGHVLGACGRDESMLLTPNRALEMLLEAWQRHDWAVLYSLLGTTDGTPLPTYSEFEADMTKIDATLLTYALSGGAVDISGQRATLVLDAQIRSNTGGDAQIICESVPLFRVLDNWSIAPQTLRSLMVRD